MPVERFNDIAEGLPRLAKLRKGEKKRVNPKTGREIVGRDQDFFRVEFEPEFEYLKPLWDELYGEKPTEFQPVVLMAETPEKALEYWMEDHTTNILLHRCTGKVQCLWYDERTGFYSKAQVACIAPECGCRLIGTLNLVFPEFVKLTGELGYITVETGSEYDIRTLLQCLKSVHSLYGTLRGVKFVFGRAKRTQSAPEIDKNTGERTGKRMKVTRSLLYMHPTPDFNKALLLPILAGEVERPGLLSGQPSLPAPEPVIIQDKERLRQSLGGGGKPKRILGRDEPNGSHVWTSAPDKVKAFHEWASRNFQYDENAVLLAFETAAAYPIVTIADWHEDRETSCGAVIALYCEYDLEAIETLTGSRAAFTVEMRDAAVRIAQRLTPEAEA